MAAGYGFGGMFLLERRVRRPQLIGLGAMLIALFVSLRFLSLYGDPAPWPASHKPDAIFPGPWKPHSENWQTVLAFLNCQKYPASLLFLLMTLGPAVLALGLFDRLPGWLGSRLITFGRVPLLYYLLHVPLIHGIAIGLDYVRYGGSPLLDDGPWALNPRDLPSDYGLSLPYLYAIWIGVVILLYPPCAWFARVKSRSRSIILSYL